MIVDARTVPGGKTIETDVCVAGAGIAGVTLTRELIGEEFRVCLLESGGMGPDRPAQSLFWGENIGHPYFPLDIARCSGFGGSSNRWTSEIGDDRIGVRLRSLDPLDFEERDWVPYSGWPFKKSHLVPFYERAHAVCQIGPFTYDVKDWEDPEKTPRLPFVNHRVKTTMFQFGGRDPFIHEYREEITQAPNITTYTHANVIEIETAESAQAATCLRVACLEGEEFRVSAKVFVLAVGAIETARLLLLSNSVQRTGLGNENDLVGRFFMEHPHLWSGRYIPSDPDILSSMGLYTIHSVNHVPVMGKLTLDEAVLRREKLLNYVVSVHPHRPHHRRNVSPNWPVVSWPLLTSNVASKAEDVQADGPKDFEPPAGLGKRVQHMIARLNNTAADTRKKTARRLQHIAARFNRSKESLVFKLNQMTEQAPNPNSRVTLAEERDMLGRNRVKLDWQLTPMDIRSIIRAQEIIDEELRRAGLGRLQIQLHGDTPPSHLEGGWHHMGTTRMHEDPKKGVVDANCRVHDTSNLFIAGPSVFPTSGCSNPVLTVVALAVRLADHVKRLMI